jgi:hypothetical protein
MPRRNPWDTETARRAGLSPNPAAYALIGRMEGFAAAAGAEAVAPEHVLLAALWDRDRMFADGPSRGEVKRALGVLGVPVPPQDPPPGDTRDRGEPVFIPVERLDDVLREMRRQLIPKDGTIAFNYYPPDRTKAFVVSDAGFDLQRLVDEVLAH